jgi:hypothetical protein
MTPRSATASPTTRTPVRPERSTTRVAGSVPAVAPRVIVALIAVALEVIQLPFGPWLIVAGLLIALALVVPRLLTAWAFVLVVGLSMLFREPSVIDWHPYVLLAGVHLVHLYAAQAVVTPIRGRLQLRVLVRPLRSFLAIQLPVQLALAVVLALHHPDAVGWSGSAAPVVAAIGAAALVALAVLVAVPALRARR